MVPEIAVSQFSFEGAVEEGGEQGSQLRGGLGLQALLHAFPISR
jgi:hypothetical protein